MPVTIQVVVGLIYLIALAGLFLYGTNAYAMLALPNAATGRAFAMKPPRWVWSLKSNFPPGTYQLEVDTSAAPINPRDWHFVVADHQCNTTDILSVPHRPTPAQVVR